MKQELEKLGKDKYKLKRLATNSHRHPALKGIKYIGYLMVSLILQRR